MNADERGLSEFLAFLIIHFLFICVYLRSSAVAKLLWLNTFRSTRPTRSRA